MSLRVRLAQLKFTSSFPFFHANLESIFLVLGKGSKNQDLPLGFDVGLRGMCIGEARRIHIPPSLAFASDKKFDLAQTRSTTIRKNQPLILDAKLISINGKVQL